MMADDMKVECSSACTSSANENMRNMLAVEGFEVLESEAVEGGHGGCVHGAVRKVRFGWRGGSV